MRLWVINPLLFPAYAGVILSRQACAVQGASFPRIRGGDPAVQAAKPGNKPLFPAYAGVIPIKEDTLYVLYSLPRIRGGDPPWALQTRTPPHFSPHTRG